MMTPTPPELQRRLATEVEDRLAQIRTEAHTHDTTKHGEMCWGPCLGAVLASTLSVASLLNVERYRRLKAELAEVRRLSGE